MIPEPPRPETQCSVDQERQGGSRPSPRDCKSVEWYAEGQSRIVKVDGVQVTVRFIGRKGRRARIAIEAPAGAVFRVND